MSCNDETFKKYPFVYSCCPDSIDGISEQFLIDLFSKADAEHSHMICGKCARIYHLFKLGMKWTEEIATETELKNFNLAKQKYLAGGPAFPEEVNENLKDFTLSELHLFTCKICKKGMFDNQPFEMKEKFIHDANIILHAIGHTLFKFLGINREGIIRQISEMYHGTCEGCFNASEKKKETSNYN